MIWSEPTSGFEELLSLVPRSRLVLVQFEPGIVRLPHLLVDKSLQTPCREFSALQAPCMVVLGSHLDVLEVLVMPRSPECGLRWKARCLVP